VSIGAGVCEEVLDRRWDGCKEFPGRSCSVVRGIPDRSCIVVRPYVKSFSGMSYMYLAGAGLL
jgi:hypothetical protein